MGQIARWKTQPPVIQRPASIIKYVGDKDMVSGTCGQMKGAMQVGCGCDGLVLNKDCDVTRNSN